ncbi:MAG: DUF309 domain-containing protein [Aquificae bacterium]|nr:DUF309 domain-containing protein [Aquificota bacterium]
MLKHLSEKFVHHMAEYFFEFEKRKHYYKLANNLLGSYERGKKFNRSLLRKVKESLPLWIDNPNQVQVYARFLNEIERDGVRTFGEAVAILPLVNLYREVWRNLEGHENKYEKLREYVEKITYCELAFRGAEGRELFEALRQNVDFFTATQLAGFFREKEFLPLNEEIASLLGINEENYHEILGSLKGANLRNLYAVLYVLLQRDGAKINFTKKLLGIRREREILKEAVLRWNSGDFYGAHELLEEVWSLFRNEDIKKCYRALIRSSIALHKLKEGERETALRVLREALLGMAECPENFRGINLGEIRAYLEEVLATGEIGNPPELKYNIKSEGEAA